MENDKSSEHCPNCGLWWLECSCLDSVWLASPSDQGGAVYLEPPHPWSEHREDSFLDQQHSPATVDPTNLMLPMVNPLHLPQVVQDLANPDSPGLRNPQIAESPAVPPQLPQGRVFSPPSLGLLSFPRPVMGNNNVGPPGSRSIIIPLGDEVGMQGLEGIKILNISEVIPPNSGPWVTIYNVDRNLVNSGSNAAAPILNHPNPTGTAALSTVRAYGYTNAQSQDTGLKCLEPTYAGGPCEKGAGAVCVDSSHDRPVPVCHVHDETSRALFEKDVSLIAPSLRAYGCSTCSISVVADLSTYHRRLNIWGLPGFYAVNGQDGRGNTSINRGSPLPLTGCDCAAKLLRHTLCGPHRLEHFLDIRSRGRAMRLYAINTFWKMVCPFCLERPGTDASGFKNDQGEPFSSLVYICMACLGLVVLNQGTYTSPDLHTRSTQVWSLDPDNRTGEM